MCTCFQDTIATQKKRQEKHTSNTSEIQAALHMRQKVISPLSLATNNRSYSSLFWYEVLMAFISALVLVQRISIKTLSSVPRPYKYKNKQKRITTINQTHYSTMIWNNAGCGRPNVYIGSGLLSMLCTISINTRTI